MVVFPPLTVIGLITNIIEYPLDKYRMLKVCQKPKRLDLSMKRFLVIWLIVTALAAFVTWPYPLIIYYLYYLYSILFYSILFYSILFYSILFYSILFYSVQFL